MRAHPPHRRLGILYTLIDDYSVTTLHTIVCRDRHHTPRGQVLRVLSELRRTPRVPTTAEEEDDSGGAVRLAMTLRLENIEPQVSSVNRLVDDRPRFRHIRRVDGLGKQRQRAYRQQEKAFHGHGV